MDEKCFSSLIVMKKSLHNAMCDPSKRGGEKMRNNLSSMGGPRFVMELAIYKQTTMMMRYVTNIHSINTLSSSSSHGYILHSLNPLFVLVFLISLLHFVCGPKKKVMHVMVIKIIMLQI